MPNYEYVYGSNLPGCLPDDMPLARCESFNEALDALLDDLNVATDQALDGLDGQEYLDAHHAWTDFLRMWMGTVMPTSALGPDGRVYFVDVADRED